MGTPGVVGIPELPYAIRVPLKIESQNKSQYSHWTIYKIYKDKWFRGLGAYLGPLKGTRLAWSKWTLNRVYSGRAREMDYGNYVGGAKAPIDALMHWGVIVDDKPSCFACTYIQTRGDENSVVLTLEEARIT
jgi:hypothetical protein